jgi:hypothetical protein
LESEPPNVTDSTNIPQSRSHIKLIALITIVAVSVIVGALLVSAFISNPQGKDAWLFKGAYATYEGSASISADNLDGIFDMSLSIDFTVRQEIIDFNDTHALISTSFQMSSSFGEYGGDSEQNEESAWVSLS